MNAGQLDERVEFWHYNIVKNRIGEDQPEEALLKTVWARVEPRTGSLLTGRPADTMLSKTTHAVTIRAEEVKNITNGCWIAWTDVIGTKHRLDIDYILPPVRTNPYTTIYAQEVV